MTIEEYLEFERPALEKHEFMDGRLFQLTPPTLRHAVISVKLSAAISKKIEADYFAHCLRVLVVPGRSVA